MQERHTYISSKKIKYRKEILQSYIKIGKQFDVQINMQYFVYCVLFVIIISI